MRDFQQLEWNAVLEDDCRQLVRLAMREDLDRWHDWTTVALVPPDAEGSAAVVARQAGRICGLRAARLVLETMDSQAVWRAELDDGAAVAAGTHLATIEGRARTLLTAERTLLNFVGRSVGRGHAGRRVCRGGGRHRGREFTTLAKRRPVGGDWKSTRFDAVAGTTIAPGLFDAILIKDNHLALGQAGRRRPFHPGRGRAAGKKFLPRRSPPAIRARRCWWKSKSIRLHSSKRCCPPGRTSCCWITCRSDDLSQAVRRRDELAPAVELEASGGVNLATVRQIAETGVDRISVGALTHSAVSLDVALDWQS